MCCLSIYYFSVLHFTQNKTQKYIFFGFILDLHNYIEVRVSNIPGFVRDFLNIPISMLYNIPRPIWPVLVVEYIFFVTKFKYRSSISISSDNTNIKRLRRDQYKEQCFQNIFCLITFQKLLDRILLSLDIKLSLKNDTKYLLQFIEVNLFNNILHIKLIFFGHGTLNFF